MILVNSPLEAFLHWETHTPERVFLKQCLKDDVITYTFAQAGNEIRRIASFIKTLNFPVQSHIALLSKNCAHWHMSDLAIMMCGHISIPIYPSLGAETINRILIHSESKAVIIGKLDNYKAQKSGINAIQKLSIGLYGMDDGILWEDVLSQYNPLEDLYQHSLDDLHTIIYTSGTTGDPKGVMHTVGNIMASMKVIIPSLKLKQHARFFSYLPLAHIAERIGIETQGLMLGVETTFPHSLDTFASDLEKCQPHLFFAVPRIWHKFQEKILEKMPQKKLNLLLNIPFLNKVIKNKLQQKLGLKHANIIVSGAAPLQASLIRWYQKIDITILQGYGMTEDCIISHFNLHGANKIGTVGKPLNTVKTKLSSEGEILVKNQCLMTGYYKSHKLTEEAFDEDYLRTGDIGEYDREGYLIITGRVKDQFKTDKGKYISPTPIELIISDNKYIEQICIVGTGIPQPIALVTLSDFSSKTSKIELSRSLIETTEKVNKNLEKHERIEKVVVMKEDWTIDNGMLTPTLKIKRNSIEKSYQELYKDWFASAKSVIFEQKLT